MSALNTPGQDDGLPHQQPQDTQHLQVHQQQQQLPDGLQQSMHNGDTVTPPVPEGTRKREQPRPQLA